MARAPPPFAMTNEPPSTGFNLHRAPQHRQRARLRHAPAPPRPSVMHQERRLQRPPAARYRTTQGQRRRQRRALVRLRVVYCMEGASAPASFSYAKKWPRVSMETEWRIAASHHASVCRKSSSVGNLPLSRDSYRAMMQSATARRGCRSRCSSSGISDRWTGEPTHGSATSARLSGTSSIVATAKAPRCAAGTQRASRRQRRPFIAGATNGR